jgi:AbrB family looped-hinge helix DNA binding protein
MYEATLSSKNQIVIPRGARMPLGLKPTDKLLVVVRDDMIILTRKPKSYADALRGVAKFSFADEYLREERGAWK